jgi:hypothetical protein
LSLSYWTWGAWSAQTMTILLYSQLLVGTFKFLNTHLLNEYIMEWIYNGTEYKCILFNWGSKI